MPCCLSDLNSLIRDWIQVHGSESPWPLDCQGNPYFFLKKTFIYLAMLDISCVTWDFQSLLQYVGSSPLTRGWMWAPCIRSMESWSQDQQGSPSNWTSDSKRRVLSFNASYGLSSLFLWSLILKSRDITLSTEVCLVKAMVFPVVMYGCESWMVKRAECWRTEAFELYAGEDSWESLGLQGDPTSPP